MSGPLEMDTMQTWVHILLGKKISERVEEGGVAIVRFVAREWRGQTRLIEFAHQPQNTGTYYTYPGFLFLLSRDQFIKFYCPVRSWDTLRWGELHLIFMV